MPEYSDDRIIELIGKSIEAHHDPNGRLAIGIKVYTWKEFFEEEIKKKTKLGLGYIQSAREVIEEYGIQGWELKQP